MQIPYLTPITQNEAERGVWEIMSIAFCQLNVHFPQQTDSKLNIYMDERGMLVMYSFWQYNTHSHHRLELCALWDNQLREVLERQTRRVAERFRENESQN